MQIHEGLHCFFIGGILSSLFAVAALLVAP